MWRTRKNAQRALLALLLVAAQGACGAPDSICLFCGDDDEENPPPVQPGQVPGTYEATRFDLGPEDQLARGAEITVTLRGDGGTTGRLFVPGGGEEGEDLDADLTGTWAFNEQGLVRLSHEADTFLRDISLHAHRQGGAIYLSGTFRDDTRPQVAVMLRRR